MSTFIPREPYSKEELQRLYPRDLELQLVQVLLRHGERSPVSPRFRNAGLHPYWPYCNAARQMRSVVMSADGAEQWSELQWRRRLETFGEGDSPVIAAGKNGTYDGICQPGELSDRGRETTLALGQRLRHLYVDQLGFMPPLIADSDMIYLRATPIPRALESVQQAFIGFYPSTARTAAFPPPTIITRSPGEETLFPNDSVCRRFAQLSRAYAQRAADRWNGSEEMAYISKTIGKWMPNGDGIVAVDSRPRLSGVMDTINATDAHGLQTKLPSEFYDAKMRSHIDQISVEEWFQGYMESQEYRMLGIGGLMGDIVARMAGNAENNEELGIKEVGGEGSDNIGVGRGGEKRIKFAMSGCHDTTLAAALASLGCYEGEKWPFFTSHIAFELFKKPGSSSLSASKVSTTEQRSANQSIWSRFFSWNTAKNVVSPIARTPLDELSTAQKAKLDDFYVRVRYNDKIMKVPGCKAAGNHYEGDERLCTLEAFKAVVDKYTPRNWKQSCAMNLEADPFPKEVEPAGH